MTRAERWWAEGLLFENCNCELLCRAHLSYREPCDHERCLGHWAIHVERGAHAETPLDGLNAFIVMDTPQIMLDGGWTQAICIDERADTAQREALERIFTGADGGTWRVLSSLVETRLETRYLPIQFRDEGRTKSMWVDGDFDATIEAIMGDDKTQEVLLVNAHNQIHGPAQTLARGTTRYAHQGLALTTDGSHAIASRFSWGGP